MVQVAERIAKEAPDTQKDVHVAFRFAATFHDGVEELVDSEEACEENRQSPIGGFKEVDECKHRMVRAVEGTRRRSSE